MAEEAAAAPAQGNAETARTETGEIKDQQATQTQASTETKTTETTSESKQPDSTEAEAEAGKVPDAYSLTAPEGYEIDAKVLEEVTPIFKELGLDNAAAQRLADVWNKHSIETSKAIEDAVTTQRNTWRDEIAKAADLGDGKDGFKPEVRKNINTAIQAIGDEKAIAAFKEAMDLTGAGDNPAFARAMNAFGKLLGEGTPVRGGAPSPEGQKVPGAGPRSAAQALFPKLPSSATS